jgi:hypothetical protein
MSNGTIGGGKDRWDKLGVIAGVLASVLVPLAIGLTGHWATSAYQQRESELKDREFARKWVEISLDILRSNDTKDEKNLRAWAINVINHYVEDESIKIPNELRTDLESGKSVVPAPSAPAEQSGGRVGQMTALETEALRHLLAKDIVQAIASMQLAYEAWPEFRTVDETLQLLRRSQPNLTDANDPDWKVLYSSIVKSMDVRGIDPAVVSGMKQEAQSN